MSDVAKAPQCLGNEEHLMPENTCQGGCRATGPSPDPVSSFCSCTWCVCRNGILEEVMECVCVCVGIRLETAACRGFGLQHYGKTMSCSAQTAVIAPYYLLCSAARGHLSSFNAQQQNPCPKVCPSVSLGLNRRALLSNYYYTAQCVSLTPSGSGEVEMPLLSVACLACLCVQPLCCPSRDIERAGWSPQDSAALPVAACFSSSEQSGSLMCFFSAVRLKKQKTIVVNRLKRNVQEQAEQPPPSPPLGDPGGPLATLLFGCLFCSSGWGCASPLGG